MFYCPSHNTRIVESRNAKFLENDSTSGSDLSRNFIPVDQPSTSSERLFIIYNTPQAQMGVEQPINEVPQPAENTPIDKVVQENPEIIEQPVEQHNPLENVIGYSDSDFFGWVDSRKSTSGYLFMFASGAMSWRSVKQTLTATSIMEAEFVSCFEATSHGVWLKSFISGLRLVDLIARPLKIHCDNLAVVFMAKNNESGSRSKHIDIKYLAIRERVKEKKVVIEHIST
ncbi:hypothetical protein V6N12_068320 [Hibiscus sabdariffa]|uniref:Retrovirus-related Pol polyprotein from transposon TNT 1-94 n=1 Tax=Hibiscus sabdariffa TaxID=183260 RepID=A0ABR2FPQ7_9ROSI